MASSLTILEASLGAGYQPIEGLRLGAAWRVLMVSGAVSSAGAVPSASPLVLTAVDIADVRSTNYGGVRLGLQYGPRDSGWGVGASWRSAVRFAAEGTASGKYENGAGVADLDKAGAATVTNTFPQQLSTGGYVDLLGRQLRVLGEYNWTQYSVNQTLEIDGTLALPAGVLGPSAIPVLADLQQSWKDQHNYRVGAEYAGISGWAIRAGYVATRSVVPIDHASATSSIPEVNHTVTMGAGTKLLGTKLNLSGALEYSFASAEVPSNSVRGFRGEYSATAYAAYFGVSYDL